MSLAQTPPKPEADAEASDGASRRLVRTALKGALGTLDGEAGHPYASLILLATSPGGAPLFLISRLARHTRNLERDPRASILIDGTDGLGNPLAGGRLTLSGLARPSADRSALRRFLARHPQAETYAGFPDFSMYELQIDGAHYIGGFGRIVDLPAGALLTDLTGAEGLLEAEADIVDHMNADHADAVELYATVLAGRPAGSWRMVGIDPSGADLLRCTQTIRLEFPTRVQTPAEARKILVSLVQQARTKQGARA